MGVCRVKGSVFRKFGLAFGNFVCGLSRYVGWSSGVFVG